jgi:hypothetical protein
MDPRIRGWTRRHTRVAVAGLVALVGAGAGLSEGGPQSILVIGALAAAFVLGLAWDGWIGIVTGLAVATVLILARDLTGTWLAQHFVPAAVETIAVIATGWTAGRAGQLLTNDEAGYAGEQVDRDGVFGSLGMLPPDLALIRLEEEVARASLYRRPLSLVVVQTDLVGADLDEDARRDVFRGAARLTESLLRVSDVPFAFSPDRIGAILPETDHLAAAVAAARILEAAATSTFTDRQTKNRRPIADVASLHFSTVSFGPDYPTAGELLDGALAGLAQAQEDTS